MSKDEPVIRVRASAGWDTEFLHHIIVVAIQPDGRNGQFIGPFGPGDQKKAEEFIRVHNRITDGRYEYEVQLALDAGWLIGWVTGLNEEQ